MPDKAVERVKEQMEEVKDAFEQGKQSARELSAAALTTSKEVVGCADEWVRDNSWKLLAVTLAAGLVLGLLLSRPSHPPEKARVPA